MQKFFQNTLQHMGVMQKPITPDEAIAQIERDLRDLANVREGINLRVRTLTNAIATIPIRPETRQQIVNYRQQIVYEEARIAKINQLIQELNVRKSSIQDRKLDEIRLKSLKVSLEATKHMDTPSQSDIADMLDEYADVMSEREEINDIMDAEAERTGLGVAVGASSYADSDADLARFILDCKKKSAASTPSPALSLPAPPVRAPVPAATPSVPFVGMVGYPRERAPAAQHRGDDWTPVLNAWQ